MGQPKANEKLSVRPAMGVVTAFEVALPAGLVVVLGFILIVTVTGGRLGLDDPLGTVAALSGWLALC